MKKKFGLLLATLLVASTAAFAGCDMLGGNSSSEETSSQTTSSSVANTYTVTFNTDGGSEVAPATVTEGNKAQKPTDPTKTGYTFAGWYKGETAFNFDTDTITANVTLTAKWTANTDTAYTIEVYAEGLDGQFTKQDIGEDANGVGTTGAIVSVPEDLKTLPADAPYVFDESNTNNVLTGTIAGDGSLVLKAYFKLKTFTVKFVNEDGTELKSEMMKYGATPVAPADPTKAETAQYTYAFAGWDSAISVVTGAKTYTATYTPTTRTYTVSFDENGGSTVEDVTVDYGTALSGYNTSKVPTKQGYTFAGWTKEDGSALPETVTGAITLKASWTANTDTAWKVEVYVEDLKDGYPAAATQTFNEEGTTDTTATVDENWMIENECSIPAGYEVDMEKSVLTGTIAADGSLVLKVYIKVKAYTVSTSPMDGISVSNATIAEVSFPGWGQFGVVDGQTAKAVHFGNSDNATVTFNESTIYEYEQIEIKVSIYDNGFGVVFGANGEEFTKNGNATFAFRFDTAGWDGTITMKGLHQDWNLDKGYDIHISSVTGYGAKETISLSSFESKVNVGEITLPTAKVTFAGQEVAGKEVAVSATFNGEPVDVSSGTYTATTEGALEITYTCGELTVTATVEFVLPTKLISKNGMENVRNTLTAVDIPGWAAFGEYASTNVQALHLVGDGSTATWNIKFKPAFVEELKKYDYVELDIVIYQAGGARMSFTANGTSTDYAVNGFVTLKFATDGWNGWIACNAEHPEWTPEYYVYVGKMTAIGVEQDKLVVGDAMTNATNATTD